MGLSIDTNFENYFLSLIQDTRYQEASILSNIRKDIENQGLPLMHISINQGIFLNFLIQNFKMVHILELGVYFGYSTLAMALALKEKDVKGAKIWACDKDFKYLEQAKWYCGKAEVLERIHFQHQEAEAFLNDLLKDFVYHEFFDLIFIDADKEKYSVYYEKSLPLLKRTGMIIFDNALMNGQVYHLNLAGKSAKAIHELNKRLFQDHRIRANIVPIGDGFIWVMKV